jgi:hypothetical protein
VGNVLEGGELLKRHPESHPGLQIVRFFELRLAGPLFF